MKLIDRARLVVRDEVGPAIRALREEQGVTMQALADQIGVCKSTINQIEQGHNKPSLELLIAVAEVLDTTLDALVPVSVAVPADHN